MTKLFSAQKAPLLRSSSVKYREVNDSSSILWHTNTNRRDSTIILRYVFVIANPSILFLFVFILIWKRSINNISSRLMNTSACIFIMQRYDQSLINLLDLHLVWTGREIHILAPSQLAPCLQLVLENGIHVFCEIQLQLKEYLIIIITR